MKLTALIEREGDGYVSLCPELDVASQGGSVEEARDNLCEALALFFEAASPDEIKQRFRGEIFVTQVEAPLGYTLEAIRGGDGDKVTRKSVCGSF